MGSGGIANGGTSSSSSGATSPSREPWNPTAAAGAATNGKVDGQYQSALPSVAAEVLRTAYERHRRGLMSPYIYQLLTQVTLPQLNKPPQ